MQIEKRNEKKFLDIDSDNIGPRLLANADYWLWKSLNYLEHVKIPATRATRIMN